MGAHLSSSSTSVPECCVKEWKIEIGWLIGLAQGGLSHWVIVTKMACWMENPKFWHVWRRNANENTYWASHALISCLHFYSCSFSGPIKLSLWACFTVFIFSHLSASNQFWGSCSARVWWLRGRSLASQATPRQQQPFFPPAVLFFRSSRIISFPSQIPFLCGGLIWIFKVQLKYPSVLGKHFLPPPSVRTSLLPALFIPGLHGSCHRGIVCCYVWEGLSLGASGVWGPCLCHLWISSTLLNYGLLSSPEVNHSGGEEGACNGSAVNTPSVFFVLDPLILFLMGNDV